MKNEKKQLKSFDELDIAILQELQNDCRTSMQVLANKLETPSSTLHYRLKRLEDQNIIDGYHIKINPEKVEKDYLSIIQVRARYGASYHEEIGSKLANLPGVWAVYFILGEWDFIVLSRLKDRAAYMEVLEQVMALDGVERTSTLIVARVIKEDPRIQL